MKKERRKTVAQNKKMIAQSAKTSPRNSMKRSFGMSEEIDL